MATQAAAWLGGGAGQQPTYGRGAQSGYRETPAPALPAGPAKRSVRAPQSPAHLRSRGPFDMHVPGPRPLALGRQVVGCASALFDVRKRDSNQDGNKSDEWKGVVSL